MLPVAHKIRDVILTCNQKADMSQLNLPHGTNN